MWETVHEDRKGILLHVPTVSPVRRGEAISKMFSKKYFTISQCFVLTDTVPPRTLHARSFVLQDQTKLDHTKENVSLFLSRNCQYFRRIF